MFYLVSLVFPWVHPLIKWQIQTGNLCLIHPKLGDQLGSRSLSVVGHPTSVRKWQGTYMAHVLHVTDAGIRIKHLEDDFEETLPLDALGGGKYLLEPVDSEDEEEATQANG